MKTPENENDSRAMQALKAAKTASRELALLPAEKVNKTLERLADALIESAPRILEAHAADVAAMDAAD
ncbi:MAG: hypothetical protein K2M00_09865, partial [Muribaculaceae bacterium]|nr:hypothetical protein [Muribaculaceae bacterium]